MPITSVLTNLIGAFFYNITADSLVDYVEELMRNVTLRREVNSAYQLATGSRFSCRPPSLAAITNECAKLKSPPSQIPLQSQ